MASAVLSSAGTAATLASPNGIPMKDGKEPANSPSPAIVFTPSESSPTHRVNSEIITSPSNSAGTQRASRSNTWKSKRVTTPIATE